MASQLDLYLYLCVVLVLGIVVDKSSGRLRGIPFTYDRN